MSARRNDIDWLRIFAVVMLVPFHTGMIFVTWPFHIKNPEVSEAITTINSFITIWHMPLFFFLAGASIFFAQSFRSQGAFIRERALRLVVPLIFGILVIIPPQVYVERILKNQFTGNFLSFYPHIFNGPYPKGNLSWHHLWFLAYLFVLTIALIPLFIYFKGDAGIKKIASWGKFLSNGGWIYAPALLLIISEVCLRPTWPDGNQNLAADWANIVKYAIIISYGFIYASHEQFTTHIEKKRRVSLGLSIAFCLLMLSWTLILGEPKWGYNIPFLIIWAIRTACTWTILLAMLGYGSRYLTARNKALDYCSEGAFPFYILHQTVILILGYFMVRMDMNLWIKYLLVMGLTFIFTLAIYEIFVKRIGPVRFLFGMKPRSR